MSAGVRPHLPQLPLSERDRRWALVREFMAGEHLDALVVHGSDAFYGYGTANLRYLTHIGSTQGAVCIFPLTGEPVVFCGPRHMSVPFNYYSKAQNWVADLRPMGGIAAIASELRTRGLDRGALGVVGYSTALVAGTIPHVFYAQLVDGLPGARIRDDRGVCRSQLHAEPTPPVARRGGVRAHRGRAVGDRLHRHPPRPRRNLARRTQRVLR